MTRLDPDRVPVIVAAGERESRDHELGPIELLERASRRALEAAPGLEATLERVTVVNILSRRAGPSPASDLAKALGLRGVAVETTSIGGNTPQAMIERAAKDIASGRLRASLIAGAEAVRAGRLRSGARPALEARAPEALTWPDPVVGVDRQDLSDEERAVGLSIPLFVYPLFESVLAQRAGRSPVRQREHLSRLLAPFTGVAARREGAWFRDVRTPEQIGYPTPDNRLVAEPYTKRMVAFLGGAHGAAVVVTSLSVARALGLDDGAIFCWSAASLNDVWYPIARKDLGASVALGVAGRAVLRTARTGIDDVGWLDIYSCFPSAVQIGAAALGVADRLRTPERLTLTGGLPYFGGPGNNYTTHAVAAMLDRLRQEPAGALGITTGVGWYLTKHSVGLYGNRPPPHGYAVPDLRSEQVSIEDSALPFVGWDRPDTRLDGAVATVEASTVVYERDGTPTGAPLIASLEDGRRVAAAAAPSELAAVARHAAGNWLVGAQVRIEARAGGPLRYRVEKAEGVAHPVPGAEAGSSRQTRERT